MSFPMVAADLHSPQVHLRKCPATEYRWDLKNTQKFPQWHSDLERIVRGVICRGFLASKPPTIDTITPHPYASTQSTLETLGNLVAEWHQFDELLYDILCGSVDLTSNQLDYVQANFQANLEGNKLYGWIKSHANQNKESQQISLINEVRAMSITDGATAADVDEAFEKLQIAWPKINSYEQSQSAIIKHALSMFENCPTHHARITTLSTLHDNAIQPLWSTFNEFRERLVETLKIAEARSGGTKQTVMFAGRPDDSSSIKPRKDFKNNCSQCDVGGCNGGDGCFVFGNKRPLTKPAKNYAALMRAYAKHQGWTKIQNVKIPIPWIKEYRKKSSENARKRTSSMPSSEVNMPMVEDDDSDVDDDFWEQIDSGHTSFMMAEDDHQNENEPHASATSLQTSPESLSPIAEAAPASYVPQLVDTPTVTIKQPYDAIGGYGSATFIPTDQYRTAPLAHNALSTTTPRASTSLSSGSLSSIRPRKCFGSTLEHHLSEVRQAQSKTDMDILRETRDSLMSQADNNHNIINDLSARNQLLQEQLLSHQRLQAQHDKCLQELNSSHTKALAASNQRLINESDKNKLEVQKLYSDLTKTNIDAARDAALAAERRGTIENIGAQLAQAQTFISKQANAIADVNKKLQKRGTLIGTLRAITNLDRPKSATFTKLQSMVSKSAAIVAVLVIIRKLPRSVLHAIIACGRSCVVRTLQALAQTLTRTLTRTALALRSPSPSPATVSANTGEAILVKGLLTPTAAKAAVLYDSGCTNFITRTMDGINGELRNIAPVSFNTAHGVNKMTKAGNFTRTIWGSNGVSVTFDAMWYYDPKMPFDIVGKSKMRKTIGAIYHDTVDANPITGAAYLPPRLQVDPLGVELHLGVTRNGLEWLGYTPPASIKQTDNIWTFVENSQLQRSDLILYNASAGVGMGPTSQSLTPLQKAVLGHCRLGHPSLRRQHETLKQTTGGMPVSKEILAQMATMGCDICNAYKLKLTDPKRKPVDVEGDEEADTASLILYDTFGKVSVPSAQFGFQYAHLWVSPRKVIGWMKGSKDLTEDMCASLHSEIIASIEAWFPDQKVKVVRMDSFSSNRGQKLLAMFQNALVHTQFSPPGQHAFIGDLERWWYPLLVGALVALRQGSAPRSQWFNAMKNQLDSECCLASRLSLEKIPTNGYERALRKTQDISDKLAFYSPGRFALDRGSLNSKWEERARSGFWVGRDIDFVMTGKTGSAIWWDGHIHRTVVNNFRVYESNFLELTAKDNKWLPKFPLDDKAIAEANSNVDTAEANADSPAPIDCDPQLPLTQSDSAENANKLPLAQNRARRNCTIDKDYTKKNYNQLCALCNTEVEESVCSECDTDWGMTELACVNAVVAQPPIPTMNLVLNLCCGPYDSESSISVCMRNLGLAVIDVDNHSEYGGGLNADITANSVYDFLLTLIRAHRIAGIISAQPCASGSVIRLRANQKTFLAEQVRDQNHPDGIPSKIEDKGYSKEIHLSNLLSFRITTLMRKVYEQGGWFFGECPAVRGDPTRPISYDPAFKSHASVMSSSYYTTLKSDTGACQITSAMCALRENYPQKLEDYIISPNLTKLQKTLTKLQCVHPPGTHTNSFAGESVGKWETKSSQTWLPELCSLIAPHFAENTPIGGTSFRLGVDDITPFLSAELRIHQPPTPGEMQMKASTTSVQILNEQNFPPFSKNNQFELDCDPNDSGANAFIITEAPEADQYHLQPFIPEIIDNAAFTTATPREPAFRWEIPNTEKALKRSPQKALWEASDQKEIDTLFGRGVFTEVIENQIERNTDGTSSRRRAWPTKIVRKLKEDAVTRDTTPRSRLVVIGTDHEKGYEYTRKDAATPMFASTLILVGECTVKDGHDFQFDLKQFFQSTEIDVPAGDMYFLPPPRYQKKVDGSRILWRGHFWVQGSKGAAYASRKKLVEIITADKSLGIQPSIYDSSLFIRDPTLPGELRFTLHVDDGIGWSSTTELAHKLRDIILKAYPDVKWHTWQDLLGFAAKRSLAARTTTLTAPKHIEALRSLVSNDVLFTPKSPYCPMLSKLQPCTPLEPDSPDYTSFSDRVSFMRAAGGHLTHIGKVRKDIVTPTNLAMRFAHLPTREAVASMKYIIFFLIGTAETGLVIGLGERVTEFTQTLVWTARPPDAHELDVTRKPLAYHVVLDGALSIDRSVSGILHMFAGIAIQALSFRQHSIAIDAYASECYTLSTGTAQAMVFRGILTEMGISQEFPTPIYSDSRSAVLVANGEASLKRSLYVARRILFLREAVDEEEVAVFGCKGRLNPSNPFTKPDITLTEFRTTRVYYMGI